MDTDNFIKRRQSDSFGYGTGYSSDHGNIIRDCAGFDGGWGFGIGTGTGTGNGSGMGSGRYMTEYKDDDTGYGNGSGYECKTTD